MLRVHEALRSVGHPGLICQTQVWCAGRLDEARLSAALAALCRRHPVLGARLVQEDHLTAVFWQFQGGGTCPLHVRELPGAGEAAVLDQAEKLMAGPLDVCRDPPVAFHLFRRPGAGDVLVASFSHILMDGRAPELLLYELDRLAGAPDADPAPPDREVDLLAAEMARSSGWRRFRGLLAYARTSWRHRDEPMTIALPDLPLWVVGPVRIALRSLGRADTDRLAARLRKLCGYESLAAAVLASGFRATAACTPRRYGPRARCRTFTPINLRHPSARRPIFRNLLSAVTVSAAREELADRDRLTRALNAQVRDGLRRGEDLGLLRMLALLRRGSGLRRAMLKPELRQRTFGFSFHGRGVAGFDSLAGTPIDRLFTLVTDAYPPGIQLQVNQCAGRLDLSLAYAADAVPEAVANTFLDVLVDDLLTASPQSPPRPVRPE
jgi:hypothetical protein